jgi:hypothetical protein
LNFGGRQRFWIFDGLWSNQNAPHSPPGNTACFSCSGDSRRSAPEHTENAQPPLIAQRQRMLCILNSIGFQILGSGPGIPSLKKTEGKFYLCSGPRRRSAAEHLFG